MLSGHLMSWPRTGISTHLFGHVRGAGTAAATDRQGAFVAATGDIGPIMGRRSRQPGEKDGPGG
jgi:hypothetical protein